ncbi:MAG: hypothetical protein ACYDGY_09830 [Acidimicrobiales bacterium]
MVEIKPLIRAVFLLLGAVVIVGAIVYGISYIFVSHGQSSKQITPVRNVPQQPLPQQNVPISGAVAFRKSFPAEPGHFYGIACPTPQECSAASRTYTAAAGAILESATTGSITGSGRAWREDVLAFSGGPSGSSPGYRS